MMNVSDDFFFLLSLCFLEIKSINYMSYLCRISHRRTCPYRKTHYLIGQKLRHWQWAVGKRGVAWLKMGRNSVMYVSPHSLAGKTLHKAVAP